VIRRVLAGVVGIAGLAATIFVAAPLPSGLLSRRDVGSLTLADREGHALRQVRSREDGRSVALQGPIPPQVRAAFLAAEDRRFGRHPGVDPLAIARALRDAVRARRIVSGASTIPMQLARQLVPHGRDLPGKLGEALWALRLCAHLDDERILREYLDRVPLGNSTSGVEAATQLYFGRDAGHLSLGQAALLAGLARSPASADPYRRPEAAQRRLASVLARMVEEGLLGEQDARLAAAAPLDLTPPERAFRAPHLAAALLSELPALGLDGAARVVTTVDPALQADVEAIVREELAPLADRGVGQAAVIVVDNRSGDVLAYVGSRDFLDEAHGGQNDGVRALRQPGSALKPFAYGLALARGYTPASILSDVETHLATPSGDYAPRNYDRRVHGPVRLRTALGSSYNVPAVRVADALGPAQVLAVMRQAGLDTLTESASHYGVGLVLGNGDVRLRDLARAYRGLALGGELQPLREILAAQGPRGEPLPVPVELAPRRFLPADATALLTDVLADPAARAPAFGLDNVLRFPFPVAVKTGTSRAHVDNWTAGFTRERTVAVWAGNFDGTPMRGVSGITGAGPIFRRVMLRAMRGLDAAPLVDRSRFEAADVCALSGERAGPDCPSVVHEAFLPGTAPARTCTMHRHDATLAVAAPFLGWARAEGIPAVPAGGGPGAASFLQPGDGDEYLLEPGQPAEDQSVPVQVAASVDPSSLEVRTGEGAVLPVSPAYTTRVPARRGDVRLELWARGGDAPLAVTRYRVR
jgi:penicillin-binding protein 1C